MEKNQEYITLEVSIRLNVKDYRAILGVKRTWIIAIVVGTVQAAFWLYHQYY